MTKKYPFFRDEDEQTQAVIGEDAIAADLNGTYQKPYAVLTQKRLYCKNERGNFIVGNDQLSGAGISKGKSTPKFLLWAAFGITIIAVLLSVRNALGEINNSLRNIQFVLDHMGISVIDLAVNPELIKDIRPESLRLLYMLRVQIVVAVIILIAFLFFQIRLPKIAPIFLCAYSMFSIILFVWDLTHGYGIRRTELGIILLNIVVIVLTVVFYFMKDSGNVKWFEIRHTTGTFTFSLKLYPAGELKNFEKQVKALQIGGTNGQ